MSEFSDQFEQLANRGTERGADAVLAAAQSQRVFPTRKVQAALAIAASVMLLGGVAEAVRLNGSSSDGKSRSNIAARRLDGTTTSSTNGPTTTLVPQVPTSKIYLASTRLVPFNQCPSLANYAKKEALDVVGPYGLPGGGGGRMTIEDRAFVGAPSASSKAGGDAGSAPAAPQEQLSADASNGAGTDFSTTNVQEAGIDEPDTVKTDGKMIFTVSQDKVFATAAGASPTVVGSFPIPQAQELLLVGNRLIVISGGGYYAYATDVIRPAAPPSASAGGDVASSSAKFAPGPYGGPTPSRFTVLDVSVPSAMKSLGSFDVDGSYVAARLVDGVARMVVRSYPRIGFVYPSDGSPEAIAAATEANRNVLNATTADTWLPHFSFTNAAGQASASKPLTTCGNSYRPPGFSGFGMLSVVTFNASDPSASKATSVMADGEIVYASAKRMYVATNQWGQVTDQNVAPTANTLIHTFDISDPTNATYRYSGKVRGTVLNQFSMSEYGGALRVATTDPNGGSESFMTVLGDSGDALVPVGQVGGLGKGEQIKAVRFIDKTAYVVTFRQTDPLYVVDLSDPGNPRVVGSLEITGYSAYLHPIAPGFLLGIGQEIDGTNHRSGFQASIFDVRNPASPKIVARKVLDQGNSNAEYDHHAFLYWPATKLAVLPLSSYNPANGMPQFNGAVGLHIGDANIDEVGRISAPDAQNYGGIERTLVIGGRLYATSPSGVQVTTLDTLTQTGFAPYPTS